MPSQAQGNWLVAGAALLATQVANGLSSDEIATLAAFFTCFADNLALIAGQLPQDT